MNRIILGLLCVVTIVGLSACSKPADQSVTQEPDTIVKATRNDQGGKEISCAISGVKVVDDQGIASALSAVASKRNLARGITESEYDEFFEALKAQKGIEVRPGIPREEIELPKMNDNDFVVAISKTDNGDHQYLWLASASQTSWGKLHLTTENLANGKGLQAFALTSNVLNSITGQLRIEAKSALGRQEFDAARNCAETLKSIGNTNEATAILLEIKKQEFTKHYEDAQSAIQEKKFGVARASIHKAKALFPNDEKVQQLIQAILIEEGGQLKSLPGEKSKVIGVGFNFDGTLAYSASDDGTIRIWELPSGKEIRRFPGKEIGITCVAFSGDGQFALSGNRRGTLKLWDLNNGSALKVFEGLGWSFAGVALSPDGRFALSGGEDAKVKLWDLAANREAAVFSGHGWRVTSVAFSPDGRFALSGCEDDTMKLWAVEFGSEVRTFLHGASDVTSVAFSPDGLQAISGCADKIARIWDLSTGKEIRSLKGHTQAIRSVSFSPDGRYALTGGDDGSLRLWDVESGEQLRSFNASDKSSTRIAYSLDGRLALTCGGGQSADLWQMPRETWPPIIEASY